MQQLNSIANQTTASADKDKSNVGKFASNNQ